MRSSARCVVALLMTVGCAPSEGRDSASATAGVSSATSTSATTGGTSTGASSTPTGSGGVTGSASESTSTTGEPTPTSSGTASSGSSTEPGTTEPVSTSSSTGTECVPVGDESCNGVDDDCNGVIDDVDVGGDGICDCLNIALFGTKGSNPAAEFEVWLEAQGTKVDRIQLDNTPLTIDIVEKYDIIILDQLVRDYDQAEAALMRDWVEDGGGLMSMSGYTGGPADVDRPNAIIKPMGLSLNNSQGIISGPVVTWNPHPVSQGITSVTFLGGFYIDIAEDGVGMNSVVGTLAQGPVGVAQVRLGGKMFIWGDEWIEYDSEWVGMPEITQFWTNILGWLAPKNFCTIPQ